MGVASSKLIQLKSGVVSPARRTPGGGPCRLKQRGLMHVQGQWCVPRDGNGGDGGGEVELEVTVWCVEIVSKMAVLEGQRVCV